MLSGPRWAKGFVLVGLTAALSGAWYVKAHRRESSLVASPEALLKRADDLAWNNRWADAQPLYASAEAGFRRRDDMAKALYAQVSQEPPRESESVAGKILRLESDLQGDAGREPETRLRILTVLGMFQTNYDAAQARSTWKEVRSLALTQGRLKLASRAEGEQGIAAFLSGDTDTAKRQVLAAWGLSKAERDHAATVRYASVFGAGLVQLGRFQEALSTLDGAIRLTEEYPELAYPTIALYAKVDALAGLHRYSEALALANESLSRLQGKGYAGHEAQILIARGSVYRQGENWPAAIEDYRRAVTVSEQMENYRGVVTAGGELAQVYERSNDLQAALEAINKAISANTRIPDELYLAPWNLAVKAEILSRLGRKSEADELYQKGITLVNGMLQHAPTKNIKRQLLAETSNVYSGYFAFLSGSRRYDEALQTLEQVRGRIEADALQHHASEPVRSPTAEDQALSKLNLALINTNDPKTRADLTSRIYNAELQLRSSDLTQQAIAHPVHLRELQKELAPNALLLEYVLAEPHSHVFAITHDAVAAYQLPAKSNLEADANLYRKELRGQKEDRGLAARLYAELIQPVKEYKNKPDLIIIPDGSLHLLPFAALVDERGYLIESHTVDVSPSATVLSLLTTRSQAGGPAHLPYIGVAAWTDAAKSRNFLVRAIDGPERSELVPLPESKREVETIAGSLPQPNAVLLGAQATETRFKQISPEGTDVIHLALHGYADLDYPDRSALVFAPDPAQKEDGLLQVREIRSLKLKAKLVTLSACNTGIGPVGQTGVENIVNAFIEAGADSVVSTLWEVEDHATEHLMEQFYRALAGHARKVDALRSAQLGLLREQLPPYYWAGVQIVGDANGSV